VIVAASFNSNRSAEGLLRVESCSPRSPRTCVSLLSRSNSWTWSAGSDAGSAMGGRRWCQSGGRRSGKKSPPLRINTLGPSTAFLVTVLTVARGQAGVRKVHLVL
jgi:hypothetical protein